MSPIRIPPLGPPRVPWKVEGRFPADGPIFILDASEGWRIFIGLLGGSRTKASKALDEEQARKLVDLLNLFDDVPAAEIAEIHRDFRKWWDAVQKGGA